MKHKKTSLRKALRRAIRLVSAYDEMLANVLKMQDDQSTWLAKKMQKTCNTCAACRECPYLPGWGEPVRWNCPHYVDGESE